MKFVNIGSVCSLLSLVLAACLSPSDDGLASSVRGGSGSEDDGGSPTCGDVELHVIAMYEAIGEKANVRIDRPGHHALVLSSYEAVTWNVTTGPGVVIDSVVATGYKATSVLGVGAATAVSVRGYEVDGGAFACGYSWPYNGGGCDTAELLSFATAATGLELSSFHGCYRAGDWTLNADRSAVSTCATEQGYQQYELLGTCAAEPPPPPPSADWQKSDFKTATPTACDGARFVRYLAEYNKFVGAVLCGSASRYKLFMAEQANDVFVEIADYAGHGQDQCELVSSTFSMPNEDDITSGGCTDCAVSEVNDLIGVPAYARARFGEPFTRVTTVFWADLSTDWYQCGVSIP
jgi:hypothetical protein